MNTTLTIQSDLLDEAMRLERRATKAVVVQRALKEFIAKRKLKESVAKKKPGILKWIGKVDFLPDFDAKKMRATRWVKVKKDQ